uniref:Integrase catalytic domain-containing protein n=1 Tax=Graphocephala atropunctata TaxID=36148 RepID=A0A1B6L3A3_9HEMI
MLLVIVNGYSKWVEVKVINSMTASATIAILDELFATYGIPVTVVSDKGTNFTSLEFKTFLQTVGVKFHKLTAPYHPATNNHAERYVKTIKDKLKTMAITRGLLQTNLNEFLQQYRKAPHSSTGQPPAQLFLGRSLRTCLDLLKPENLYTKITEKQQETFNPTFSEFHSMQLVFFLSGNLQMDKWIPGTITHSVLENYIMKLSIKEDHSNGTSTNHWSCHLRAL